MFARKSHLISLASVFRLLFKRDSTFAVSYGAIAEYLAHFEGHKSTAAPSVLQSMSNLASRITGSPSSHV